jgi:hypothetical protein
MGKKLLCYLGLHRYVRHRTADGGWYKECRRCGKFQDAGPGRVGRQPGWF